MSTPQEIHDLIQQCPVEPTSTAISRILDVLTAMNDELRLLAGAQHVTNNKFAVIDGELKSLHKCVRDLCDIHP